MTISGPFPNTTSPDPEYIDLIQAYIPANSVASGTTFELMINQARVLRRDGALGGYHWGLPLKRGLLAWESARRDSAAAAPSEALA